MEKRLILNIIFMILAILGIYFSISSYLEGNFSIIGYVMIIISLILRSIARKIK